MIFSERIQALASKAEQALAPRFAEIDQVSYLNTQKVMDAFREHRVNETLFNPPAATAITTAAERSSTRSGQT